MRLTAIEAIPVRIPLKPERRMISALGRHEVSDFVIVRLKTDNGPEGNGEATVTARWSGETVWGTKAIIDHVFAPVLLGCDPLDLDTIEQRLDAVAYHNAFAKSAIEMACWDIAGKLAGKPVYELLGGACRSLTVRNRFSLGAYEPKLASERAQALVAKGFDTIKIKVGTDPDQDVARVKAVRAAIGEDVAITIDANGGWNEPTAIACLEALKDCRITIVEQPLPRGNYTGLKRVRNISGHKILADESCFEMVEAEELVAHGSCDAISLYPGKQSGIRKARKVADYAERHGIPCSIGSNLEWDLGAAAMMHFIVSTPNMRVDLYPGDCLGPFYHEVSIAKIPLKIEGPFTTLHEGPGLGIDIDWDVIASHTIKF
jgi:muconate cycloisomerase